MLALLIGTVACILTGCAGPHGGHRGGIATGLIGTTRTLTPESNIQGTTFVLNNAESKVGSPLSARFVLDTRDDGGQPVSIKAFTPGGQQQEMTLSWTTSGWKALTFVGVNGLTTAIVGVGSIPGWIGDGRNRLSSDIENNRPRFIFDPRGETPTPSTATPIQAPAPTVTAAPTPAPAQTPVQAPPPQALPASNPPQTASAQVSGGNITFGGSTIINGVATVSAPQVATPTAPAPSAQPAPATPATPAVAAQLGTQQPEKVIRMGFVGDK
ncbi:MAG: hypothetical protein RIT04_10 [Candidatus Parcubacteria bacterium]